MKSKQPLGRGLEALFSNEKKFKENNDFLHDVPNSDEKVKQIKVDYFEASPFQPRDNFNEQKLQELSDSIKEKGVIQPIIARKLFNNHYEIIAGERRLRAAKLAGLETIPAVIRKIDDREASDLALLENLQRDNLNIVEEAYAYQKILTFESITQEELAKRIGKSRAHIANALRITRLENDLRQALINEKMTFGQAKLLASKSKEIQLKALARILSEPMSVKELTTYLQNLENLSKGKQAVKKVNSFAKVEKELSKLISHKVKISQNDNKKGTVKIKFANDEQMNQIIELIKKIGSES